MTGRDKALLLVIVIVALLTALVLIGSGDLEKDNGHGYAYYDYRVDLSTALSDGYFSTTADEGMTYAVLTYTIRNETDQTITLNPLLFEWLLWVDNVSYGELYGTTVMYLDGYTTSTIRPGGTATQMLAYEIPLGKRIQDITFDYGASGPLTNSNFVHDASITVTQPTLA